MNLKRSACLKEGPEDSCHCDECRTLKIEWWLSKRASLYSLCSRFREAHVSNDRATLDELQSTYGFGCCLCCGFTLLHLAVSVASKELVGRYLSRNHNVDTKTEIGETALHLACALDDPWFLEQLLIHKADVDAVDGLGCTPLQVCLSYEKPPTAILKILLNHGARPNKLFRPGEDNEESVDKMVKANTRNSSGVMPLYEAVHNGNHADVRGLLQDGACPNSLKCYRWPLLQVACLHKSILCAMTLLEAGADVNETDLEGQTALHYAAISNSQDLVKLLASHKCDLWARDSDDYTALEMAVLTNCLEATNELLKQGAWCTESLLLEALENRCTDVVLLLLSDCDLRVHDTKFGQTLLSCAVTTKQQRVVNYLLSVGVKSNSKTFCKKTDAKPRIIANVSVHNMCFSFIFNSDLV